MNESAEAFPENNPSGFFSPDCIDFVIDGPGDTTVRPATGIMRELLLKERERLAAWREWERLRDENPDNPPPLPEV